VDIGESGLDGERLVDLSDDEPILPDAPVEVDGADRGDWLRDERPPHWD
jgi:hypothetical protein